MVTLAQFQQHMQQVLGVVAQQAGQTSGFIQRKRKLSGETFVSSLVWGWMANPEATLNDLSQSAALCGVQISPQGLAQRMTAQAAICLQHVLEASLLLTATGSEGSTTFLRSFNGVYLLDSTDIPVPLEWQQVWSGSGTATGKRAAFKVQTLWDYHGGGLQFSLHPARCHDARLPVPVLPRGAVRVTDCGYFDTSKFKALEEHGCFYVTRVPSKVHVYDEAGKSCRLSVFLQRVARLDFDGYVTLTAQGLTCRLVAQRVPARVVAQRRARLHRTAKRRGKPVSQEALALSAWTIVVTNLPPDRLTATQAIMLLRLRWQLELLFKLWKQHAQLETSRSQQPHRILCEIYAKLLGLLIQHALLLATCWDVPNRSLVKLAKTLRHSAFLLAVAIWTPPPLFLSLLFSLRFALRSGCHLDTRKAQPSHFQHLLSLS